MNYKFICIKKIIGVQMRQFMGKFQLSGNPDNFNYADKS